VNRNSVLIGGESCEVMKRNHAGVMDCYGLKIKSLLGYHFFIFSVFPGQPLLFLFIFSPFTLLPFFSCVSLFVPLSSFLFPFFRDGLKMRYLRSSSMAGLGLVVVVVVVSIYFVLNIAEAHI